MLGDGPPFPVHDREPAFASRGKAVFSAGGTTGTFLEHAVDEPLLVEAGEEGINRSQRHVEGARPRETPSQFVTVELLGGEEVEAAQLDYSSLDLG